MKYIPKWNANRISPKLNDGKIVGIYDKENLSIWFDFGNNTEFGSGHWTFSIPLLSNFGDKGLAVYFDNSYNELDRIPILCKHGSIEVEYPKSTWLKPGNRLFIGFGDIVHEI